MVPTTTTRDPEHDLRLPPFNDCIAIPVYPRGCGGVDPGDGRPDSDGPTHDGTRAGTDDPSGPAACGVPGQGHAGPAGPARRAAFGALLQEIRRREWSPRSQL